MLPMPILKILSDWLRAHDKTQPDIDRYAFRFAHLRHLDPVPCPVCYLEAPEGEVDQSLMLLGRLGNEVPMFCPRCRTMFKIPVEYVPIS